MPFAYYERLSPRQKSIYRRSDAIDRIHLPRPHELRGLVPRIATSLENENPRALASACQALADGILKQLAAPPVRVCVRDVRPSDDAGEIHGLYEPGNASRQSRISLWMRTAQRAQVVAFRTFLRTLLHELCHHLDYELFELAETFHTDGFYKRESSLFNQLVLSSSPKQ